MPFLLFLGRVEALLQSWALVVPFIPGPPSPPRVFSWEPNILLPSPSQKCRDLCFVFETTQNPLLSSFPFLLLSLT